MATKSGILLKSTSAELTSDGWQVTEGYVVTSAVYNTPVKILDEVIGSLLPSIGDAHPDKSTCKLQSIKHIRTTGLRQIEVELFYGKKIENTELGYDFVEIGATAYQISTNQDKEGDDLFVQYTYPEFYPGTVEADKNEAYAGKTAKQGGTVTKYVPQGTEVFRKKKTISESNMRTLRDGYVGKINSDSWKGNAAKSMLCVGINGVAVSSTQYDITYQFIKSDDEWKGSYHFVCPDSGKPPEVPGENGLKSCELYDTVAFSGLGL